MKLGYARVSTGEQNLDLQEFALRNAGCSHIFTDKGVSGSTTSRVGLDECLKALQPGDVLVVWKLDRLGRSLAHLVDLLAKFGKDGIGFKSTTEGLDTTTAAGRAMYQIIGVFAEFERSINVERTRAGMAAARVAGKAIGRPHRLSRQQAVHARDEIASGKSRKAMAEILGVETKTLSRALARLPKA